MLGGSVLFRETAIPEISKEDKLLFLNYNKYFP